MLMVSKWNRQISRRESTFGQKQRTAMQSKASECPLRDEDGERDGAKTLPMRLKSQAKGEQTLSSQLTDDTLCVLTLECPISPLFVVAKL